MFGSASHVGSCVFMCEMSVSRRVNARAHAASSHLYGRWPVCTRRWRARLDESPNVFPQPGYSHACGRSPVCVRLCTCSAEFYGLA